MLVVSDTRSGTVSGEPGRGDVVVAKGLGDDRRGHVQNVLADGCAASGDDGNSELVDEGGEIPGDAVAG
jgi:hypothetical protein